MLRDELADLDETARENVVLVATELLSNAIRPARPLDDGMLAIAWDIQAYVVRVSVESA